MCLLVVASPIGNGEEEKGYNMEGVWYWVMHKPNIIYQGSISFVDRTRRTSRASKIDLILLALCNVLGRKICRAVAVVLGRVDN